MSESGWFFLFIFAFLVEIGWKDRPRDLPAGFIVSLLVPCWLFLGLRLPVWTVPLGWLAGRAVTHVTWRVFWAALGASAARRRRRDFPTARIRRR
jgi:hypothetical protein